MKAAIQFEEALEDVKWNCMVEIDDDPKKPFGEDDMFSLDTFAGQLYERYCKSVGKPFPKWKEFRCDPAKRVQSEAWVRVAEAAYDRMVGFDTRDSN